MMLIALRTLVAFIMMAVLSACVQHLTQEQCQSMNWYQLGYSQGTQGQPLGSLQQDIEDCAQFKITPDYNAYQNGYNAGVKVFCTPTTAYHVGSEGQPYPTICPASVRGELYSQWQSGLRLYCVPQQGFALGKQGAPMPEFCPPDLSTAFRSEYNRGLGIHQAVASLQAQQQTIQGQITALQNDQAVATRQGNGDHAALDQVQIDSLANQNNGISQQIAQMLAQN